MGAKSKIIGFIIIILGVLPFLLKVETIASAVSKYHLESVVPGNIIYQGILIVLGVLLIMKKKQREARK